MHKIISLSVFHSSCLCYTQNWKHWHFYNTWHQRADINQQQYCSWQERKGTASVSNIVNLGHATWIQETCNEYRWNTVTFRQKCSL